MFILYEALPYVISDTAHSEHTKTDLDITLKHVLQCLCFKKRFF